MDFGKNGFNYTPEYGDNWWSYYFKTNQWGNITEKKRVPDYQKNIMHLYAQFDAKIQRLHALYKTYIRLNDDIIHEVHVVTQHYLQHTPTIGIYYESKSNISYKKLVHTIKKTLKKHKKATLDRG